MHKIFAATRRKHNLLQLISYSPMLCCLRGAHTSTHTVIACVFLLTFQLIMVSLTSTPRAASPSRNCLYDSCGAAPTNAPPRKCTTASGAVPAAPQA